MRLSRVKIKNFRLFKDCEINFSKESEKKLTVIRAENDSGKTTLMTALQWVLFGEDSLPYRGKGFRLHPINFTEYGQKIDISVEIEFEHIHEGYKTETYCAIRTATEKVLSESEFKREQSNLKLFKIESETGYIDIEAPELYLEASILGSNLKDLFFTDGDRALNFISAESSTNEKRKLVKQAIRDMLGLEILEASINHVEEYRRSKTRQLRESDNSDVSNASEYVEKIESSLKEINKEIETYSEDVNNLSTDIADYEKNINRILEKGNKENLVLQKKTLDRNLKKNREDFKEELDNHAKLIQSEEVFKYLLKEKILPTLNKLNKMWDNGQLPKTTAPILKDCLHRGECLCGRDLIKGELSYTNLEKIINEQESASKTEKRLAELRVTLVNMNFNDVTSDDIKDLFGKIIQRKVNLLDNIKGNEAQKKSLENTIDELNDADIDNLKAIKSNLDNERTNKHTEIARLQIEIDRLEESLAVQQKNLAIQLSNNKKFKSVENCINGANDILNILRSAHNEISQNEVRQVSSLMNKLFMDMIRSDPNNKVIISRVEITKEYDIKAYSKNNKELNPDTDLNGASKRALTLSFILALTNISQEIAPNIIDTPLGMMDPLVKKSVLQTVLKHSDQLILFLTRSEINDVEDILDEHAGTVITLSNSSHYGTKLVNDPKVEYQTIACSCSHREYCNICERLGDDETENLEYIMV